ncbi:MAG TPA: BTAD domain-containing putative transcriptional regulator, partial [Microbacterium sp.]|nr:BTAD domain-containing putative transcriptional regulator [Microbacterium sp.]
ADDLWPALDGGAQSRNLRVTLTHLLRVLEPERAERDASFLVRPHGGGLLLHRGEWLRTDVWEFDDLWHEATDADRDGRPSAALESMVRAVDLWRGDPAELAAEEWALPEVEERSDHGPLLRDVFDALLAGEPLPPTATEPARSVEIVAAIYASAAADGGVITPADLATHPTHRGSFRSPVIDLRPGHE